MKDDKAHDDGADIRTADEAAALLKIKPSTLAAWRCHGTGPRFIKLGNAKNSQVRYRVADLVEFLNRSTEAA